MDQANPPNTGVTISIDETLKLRSLCVRFLIWSLKKQSIITSDDISIQMYFEQNLGFLKLNGNAKEYIFSMPHQIPPFYYQHFCFTHDETDYKVACNGILWYTAPLFKNDIPLLKKDLKITNLEIGPPDYADMFYFNGKVSELYIFSNTFTTEELISISKDCSIVEKGIKVFDWAQVQTSDIIIPQSSDIEIEIRNRDYFCLEKDELNLGMLPFWMTAEAANINCRAWSGKVFLPQSSKDLEKMKMLVTNGKEIIRNNTYDKDICKDSVWLPLHKTDGYNKWVDYNDRSKKVDLKIPFSYDGDGQSIQMCAVHKHIGSNIMYDVSCNRPSCVICVWKPNIKFRLRGLCEKSKIENRYLLSTYHLPKRALDVKLWGFVNNAIIYDTKLEEWVIIDYPMKENYKILGIYRPKTLNVAIPKGDGAWDLFDPNCNETRVLKVTSVKLYLYFIIIFNK